MTPWQRAQAWADRVAERKVLEEQVRELNNTFDSVMHAVEDHATELRHNVGPNTPQIAYQTSKGLVLVSVARGVELVEVVAKD